MRNGRGFLLYGNAGVDEPVESPAYNSMLFVPFSPPLHVPEVLCSSSSPRARSMFYLQAFLIYQSHKSRDMAFLCHDFDQSELALLAHVQLALAELSLIALPET